MKIQKNIYEERYGIEDLIWGQIENARILDDGTLQIFFFTDNRDVVELLEIRGSKEVYHEVKKAEDVMIRTLLPSVIDGLNKICGGEKFYSIKNEAIYYGTRECEVEVCSLDEIISLKIDKDIVEVETLKFIWKLTDKGPII